MHWLFSLKYWVIAREVPKLWQENGQPSFNERMYTIINCAGFFIIFVLSCLAGIIRGRLSYVSEGMNQQLEDEIANRVILMYFILTGMQLMFAAILGDALRRIVKSLKSSTILEINYKMLIVHVFLVASMALV